MAKSASKKAPSGKKPVFWVFGNRRECRKQLSIILSKVESPNIRTFTCGFNPKSWDGPRLASAADVVCELRSRDLFSNRPRVFKVLSVGADYDAFIDALKYVNGNNILIFYCTPNYRKDSTSKQNISLKTTTLYKTVKEIGTIFEFPITVKWGDAIERVIEVAKDEGKTIARDVANELVKLKGCDLDHLEMETVKLATYQEQAAITVEDVRACCSEGFADDIFAFIRLLDAQDIEGALSFLQRYYKVAGKAIGESFYGEFLPLLYNLGTHYRFIFHCKDICGDGPPVAQKIQDKLRNFKKITPSLAKDLAAMGKSRDEAKIDGRTEDAQRISGDMAKLMIELPVVYTPQAIGMKLSQETVRTMMRWTTSRLYNNFRDLKRCELLMRQNSGNPEMVKICLDTFALFACGKITLEEAAMARGHKGKYT